MTVTVDGKQIYKVPAAQWRSAAVAVPILIRAL